MTERKPRLVDTLVSWIHPQVMVFLGKVQNPMTGKTERDLPSARILIDILSELEEKTEGRLEDEEKRHLKTALTELRLNYLDEMNRPAPPQEKAGESEDPPAQEAGELKDPPSQKTGESKDAPAQDSGTDGETPVDKPVS